MHHFHFIWMPFTGKEGTRQFIEALPFDSSIQAHEHALVNRATYCERYGAGQVVVSRVETYIHV